MALTAIGASGFAATSAAAESSSLPQGILADGLDVEGGDFWAFFRGFRSARQIPFSRKPSIENVADSIRNEFTANEEHWIAYGNWLIDKYDVEPLGTTTVQVDVIEVNRLSDDEHVPTTIQSEYDETTEQLTAIAWEIGEAEDPDYQVGIEDKHARLATEDLQEFRRRYIDESGDGEHELPDGEYVEELKGRYWDGLRFGEDSQTVIELLVGEVTS
ncbi:hypothetical protein [Halosolutus gelatinilyticus]|uniref:hypothetical protein n=1 Tax=Halosolutus gelatinilyticus TaxID=2931975 RepID=UPI001FF1F4EA|nr:hypothetical protein [Halosolutus gelatinilyticus]